MGTARLTIAGDVLEAEMICGLLRTNGIACWHRQTDVAAGAWAGLLSAWGPVEILVDASKLDDARAFLAEPEDGADLEDC
jgi:hypothetical protein